MSCRKLGRLFLVQFALSFALIACDDGGKDKNDAAVQDTSGIGDTQQSADSDDSQPEPDVTGDTASDVGSGLPTLPAGKTFTTRYAAGAASVVVTPQAEKTLLGGYGICIGKPDACRYAEGVHDDLYCNAVAIADTQTGETAVLVGCDAVGLLGPDMVEIHKMVPGAFAERLSVKMDGPRVIVSTTHTHHAPDTVGLWGPMTSKLKRDEIVYIEWLRSQAVEAAVQAFENLGDIELVFAQGTAPNDDLDVQTDDEKIFVVQGKRPEGEVVFTWVRWPGHPTMYPMENNGISADWVGAFRKKLAEDGDVGTIVFQNGPIGSVYGTELAECSATDAFPDGWQDPDVTPEHHRLVACMGYTVAENTLEALNSANPVSDSGLKFRHKTFEFHPTNGALFMLAKMGPIPIPDLDVNNPEDLMPSSFSWLSLGQLEILTTPGESFPSFARHLAEALQPKTPDGIIITLGLAQDWMGYLLTEEQWPQEDLGYNRSLSPGETVEPAMVEALGELSY